MTDAFALHDPAADQTLDEWLYGDEPDWEAEPPDLADAKEADRMLSRYLDLEREHEAVKIQAAEKAAQIAAWAARRHAALEHRMDWLRRSLDAWALSQRTAKRKSFDLPSGVLRTREVKARWVVSDPAAWALWCEAHDRTDLLVWPPAPGPKPDLSAMKAKLSPAELTVNGEAPPAGVEFEPEHVRVYPERHKAPEADR